ncbi:MAG: hypothetical protein ACI9J3_003476 [Parvicellaceae bacterium]
MIRNISILFLISLLFVGCKKYDEGPGLSLRSKNDRAINIWTFSSVENNAGINITSTYVGWLISLDENGNLLIRWDVSGATIDTYGTWSFSDKKTHIDLVYSSTLLELAVPKSLEILKLKNKELNFQTTDGSRYQMNGSL